MYAYTWNLEFDWRDVVYLPVQVMPHGTIFRRNVDYFLATLERFLAFHLGSKVVSFKVLCFFPSMYVLQVNDWIDFAIGKGVEDLDLAFTCDNPPKCTGWSGLDYFPAQILLNDEESKLRRLSLRGCMLKSNFTTGFRTLSTLVLCDVNLAGHVEPHMFSSCLNLEHLTLQRCFGLERLCIGDSLQCLKVLVVIRCDGLKGIELNATNLTSFHYKGDQIEFSFEMVPNLEEVYVMMLEINVVPTYAWLEKQLPHVKTLAVVRGSPKTLLLLGFAFNELTCHAVFIFYFPLVFRCRLGLQLLTIQRRLGI